MRTLAVTYDSQGERFRDYRVAVALMQEDPFGDWPLEGPRTALWVGKFFARQKSDPSAWLNKDLAEHRYHASDRAMYELKTIAEVLAFASTSDHLNVASLAALELLIRRWELHSIGCARCAPDPARLRVERAPHRSRPTPTRGGL